jgi:hypothetical protein
MAFLNEMTEEGGEEEPAPGTVDEAGGAGGAGGEGGAPAPAA